MTTKQQNRNFIEDITENLGRWSQKPTLLIMVISLIVGVVLFGGLFFWASQFSYAFGGESGNRSQLQTAQSGLQTMKRMVGNQQVWSESIQEEYAKIFVDQPVKTMPISYNYGDNFFGPDYSTNQVWIK